MTTPLGQPPRNSWIVLGQDGDDEVRLSWRHPVPWASRWLPAAFLAFWLCGWAVGEVVAALAFVSLLDPAGNGGGAFHGLAALFLFGWLGAWTAGGLAAVFSLYKLVRGPRPEGLTLGLSALKYNPGTGRDFTAEGADDPTPVRKVLEIPRSEMGPVRLERVGGRQRLSLDWGAERVEIGRRLREPEREWLAEVLRRWAGQAPS